MGKRKDITGQRFGRLTALSFVSGRKRMFRCDCGIEKLIDVYSVIRGLSKSCGCLAGELTAARNKAGAKHGMCGTSIYSRWQEMMHRCYNSNHKDYRRWGGRGIKVCKRWHQFENYYADMGDPPKGMTVERRNNNKGYSPSNCYWATVKEQANNRRSSHFITANGQTKTVTQWAEEIGVDPHVLFARLRKKWPIELLLSPLNTRRLHRVRMKSSLEE